MNFLRNLNNTQTADLARALTHYVFRNGVVEDIHASGKLSNSDMMVLNQDVYNRIGGLLVALREGRESDVLKVLSFHALYGQDWNECVPYMDDFNAV